MMSEKTLERVMKANDSLARKNAELEAENLELQKDRDIMSFKQQKLEIKAQFVMGAITDMDGVAKSMRQGDEKGSFYLQGYLSAMSFAKKYVKELKEEINK